MHNLNFGLQNHLRLLRLFCVRTVQLGRPATKMLTLLASHPLGPSRFMPPLQFSTFQWQRFSNASIMILTILHLHNFADPNTTPLHVEYLITAVTSLMIHLRHVRGIMLSMISGWTLIQRSHANQRHRIVR